MDDVLRGLERTPKQLACKYLYDARGSQLFEEICDTKAYYPTRTELQILERFGPEIARAVGPDQTVVELGSGSGLKTRLLLSQLNAPRAYLAVEINAATAKLPTQPHRGGPMTVFFPGSTLGNFSRSNARDFMAKIAQFLGQGGGFLVGIDTKKDPELLTRAYNDPDGVTASFNLNLLRRLNRELNCDFKLEHFRHHAIYHPIHGRIESYLISTRDQQVQIGPTRVDFRLGEPIHTEYSYKYTTDEFHDLAESAGFTPRQVWHDPKKWFSVHYLEIA